MTRYTSSTRHERSSSYPSWLPLLETPSSATFGDNFILWVCNATWSESLPKTGQATWQGNPASKPLASPLLGWYERTSEKMGQSFSMPSLMRQASTFWQSGSASTWCMHLLYKHTTVCKLLAISAGSWKNLWKILGVVWGEHTCNDVAKPGPIQTHYNGKNCQLSEGFTRWQRVPGHHSHWTKKSLGWWVPQHAMNFVHHIPGKEHTCKLKPTVSNEMLSKHIAIPWEQSLEMFFANTSFNCLCPSSRESWHDRWI